jgi:hypothetical protein
VAQFRPGSDDVRDPQVCLACGRQVDIDVTARVDDRREPCRLVGHECGQVAEPFDPELGDAHRGSL